MMKRVRLLTADRSAAAAAEIALALPLLVALIFGPLEVGYYFMSEHIVQKAVRDAARYAARLPVTNFDCSTDTINSTALQQIRRVAKSGDPDGDWDDNGVQDQRLAGWTSDDKATVTLTCDSDTTHVYVNKGIYADFSAGVPVVTVSASMNYPSLFGTLGIPVPTLTLNAQSQAAVFGA